MFDLVVLSLQILAAASVVVSTLGLVAWIAACEIAGCINRRKNDRFADRLFAQIEEFRSEFDTDTEALAEDCHGQLSSYFDRNWSSWDGDYSVFDGARHVPSR